MKTTFALLAVSAVLAIVPVAFAGGSGHGSGSHAIPVASGRAAPQGRAPAAAAGKSHLATSRTVVTALSVKRSAAAAPKTKAAKPTVKSQTKSQAKTQKTPNHRGVTRSEEVENAPTVAATKAGKGLTASQFKLLAQGSGKPNSLKAKRLQRDLKTAMQTERLKPEEAAKLSEDLQKVEDSGKLSKAEVDAAIADANSILEKAGFSASDTEAMVANLKEVADNARETETDSGGG